MNILITGANGQLGQEFKAIAVDYPQFNFLLAARQDLDISSSEAIETYFHKHQVDCCVNCAAYTAVDKAESDTADAIKHNVDAVRYLATVCQMQTIPLIHISTDYIYHSSQNIPYREEDLPNPQGAYAQTKYAGEYAAFESNERVIVIRTSWVYSNFGHNFVKTMLRLGTERDALRVVFDQIGSPTYARDLAKAILHVIQQVNSQHLDWATLSGVFNYSNEGVTSWYDFAKAIFELKNIPCKVSPIESSEYPTPAQRPPFSVMNKSKIKTTFDLEIPHWRDSLREMLKLV